MKKNVRFYKWVIRNTKDKVLSSGQSKKLLKKLISTNTVENSILLREKSKEKKNDRNIYLDILKNDDDFLFGKISKSKFRHDMQKRNEKNKQTGDVLSDSERNAFSVELTSYFLYNYNTQIILYIYTGGAGTINNLNDLILKHSDKYDPNICAIVNKGILEKMLNCEYLNNIEISIASPNSKFLTSDVIHIKDEAVLALQESKIGEIKMQIKPERGDNLSVGQSAKVILKGLVELAKSQKMKNPKQREIKKLKVSSKDLHQKRYSGIDLYEDKYILEYNFDIEDINNKAEYFKKIYSCLKDAYYDNIETVKIYS